MKITILHDKSHNWGYGPSDLEEVYSYEVEDDFASSIETVLEHAFHAFNVGDPRSPIVHGYRAAGLRSLSTGDAVRVGDDTYLCKSAGWEKM